MNTDTEREKAIVDAIDSWQMGFLRADEMVEIVCELDDQIGPKVLERLNRIKASDKYLRILAEFEHKISDLLLEDEGIFALINYHKLIAWKG